MSSFSLLGPGGRLCFWGLVIAAFVLLSARGSASRVLSDDTSQPSPDKDVDHEIFHYSSPHHSHGHRHSHTHSSLLKREDDHTCSASRPCTNGACCGASGFCGYGPTYCGDGCMSNCDARAECGKYASTPNTKCPLNTW